MTQPNSNTANETQDQSNRKSLSSQQSEVQSQARTDELANLVKKVNNSQAAQSAMQKALKAEKP